ncbi:MAG: coagulation factor 5/8 type domain-containing protein [Acidobacteria bacterium]|nr:coagulation factor 5/8 type domain-containing protein [Acidobacteriota bacterium]
MRQVHLRSTFLCTIALVASAAVAQTPQQPDFGSNVAVLSPSTPQAQMQAEIDRVYAIQQHNEFGTQRNAFLLMPGDYHLNVPIGFYTEVEGLGATPDATHIYGDVHVDAAARNNNATTTFWRAAENFAVTPSSGTMQWAVSQAVPMRRMHILGNLVLNQKHGWASGGWMSDTLVDGNVDSGTQQQWISRNDEWKRWTGANWNMVFVGVPEAPAREWPKPPYTEVARTPVVREKPYLQADAEGHWSIHVPALTHDTAGVSWRTPTSDRVIPFSEVYLAHAARDTAATINGQLARGKNLLLTPGVYNLSTPLRVTHANTVVLGLGFATLRPIHGTAALTTADVDGITVAGLLIDAGEKLSPVLMQVGPRGSHASHARNPVVLHDVFFRVGGAGVGRAGINLEINSNSTIVDHTWIWRADHGNGVGWDKNLSRNGLVVNADDVTIYGLFVEHHQQFQVLWNGNRGRTYFYQSEIPYDPPTQAAYSSAPGVDGWASYKVANRVTQHEAWGLGAYSVFTYPNVFLTRAIEVPTTPKVVFHDMITVCLETRGGIRNVIDDTGGATSCATHFTPKVTLYPPAK